MLLSARAGRSCGRPVPNSSKLKAVPGVGRALAHPRARPLRQTRIEAARPTGGGGSDGAAPRDGVPQPPNHQDFTNSSGSSSNSVPADAAAAAGQAGSGNGALDRILGLPLLLISTLSHVNSAYIKMRRRRKWWSKLGGYPKVPSDSMDQLPEPAIELWHKVVPLGLIFFAASFNLTVLQSLKDSIVVVASGAETLPFLMSLCVLPASVGFFVMYGSMVTHLPERAVFYAAVAPLLVFYALFATFVYPLSASLHLDASAVFPLIPTGLHGLIKVVSNWTYSLFFVVAELWGSVVISVLFWSLANETVTVDEAKAVYPFMAIGANIALVASGCFIRAVNAWLPPGDALLGLRVLVASVLVMSIAMFGAKAFIDSRILGPMQRQEAAVAAAAAAAAGEQQQPAVVEEKKKGGKKKKEKGSFSENFAVLRNSAKIRNLALLVMGYGVAHRLFEFAWKAQLRVLHPTVQGYQSVLADVSTYTGMLTLVTMVLSRLIFQHLGWGVAASVTPTVMGLAGAVFFGATLLGGGVLGPILPEQTAAVLVGVGSIAGIVTQVFARSSKYSLFDPAREMCYIEMDKEEKRRGKAAVDLVGSQIGKSGASWITQAALLLCGSMAAAMPFTGAVFVVVIILWIQATFGLHREMQATERARLEAAAAAGDSSPGSMLSYEETDGGKDGGNNGSNSSGSGGAGKVTTTAAAAAAGVPRSTTAEEAAVAARAAAAGTPAAAPSPQPPSLADALSSASGAAAGARDGSNNATGSSGGVSAQAGGSGGAAFGTA